jgi:hypothetical protein
MNKENSGKQSITFKEFKAWINGLIVGKRGALPDLEDWKKIREMMDKVDGDETEHTPSISPTIPYYVDPPPHLPKRPQWSYGTGSPCPPEYLSTTSSSTYTTPTDEDTQAIVDSLALVLSFNSTFKEPQ